jgi:hypothetical protein
MANFGTFAASQVLTAAELNKFGGAWTTHTPTYTNLTIGNGTVDSKYVRIGRLCAWRWKFTLGSTSSVGTNPELTLPTAAATATVEANSCPVFMLDASVPAFYTGIITSSSTTAIIIGALGTAASYLGFTNITATVPFTWTTSDAISFLLAYETSTDPS